VITGVRKIIVPVNDQATAKSFWTERVGFEPRVDQAYGDERWIEVGEPRGGPLVLVLSPRPAGQALPDVPDGLPHSPVFFACDDIRTTHRELVDRGVRFAAAPVEMPFGWWAMFEDPDGARHALGQWG
jgi:predicted enzyme related to lactoylglutathione lyase